NSGLHDGQSQRAVRARMRTKECNRAIHPGSGQRIDVLRNLQESVEDEWSERLAGVQQAIRAAVPSAVRSLLLPEIISTLRHRCLVALTSGDEDQEQRDPGPSHQFRRDVVTGTAGSRPASRVRIAALVTATRPVMQ